MRLAELIRLYRKWNELKLRDIAGEIGISAATLMRLEAGRVPDGETLAKVLVWLMAKM
jgi:transcriptional regulator with XRE-family HTH domain